MIKLRDMDKVIMKMENIIKVNGKMVQGMEKEFYLTNMEILNVMVILIITTQSETLF